MRSNAFVARKPSLSERAIRDSTDFTGMRVLHVGIGWSHFDIDIAKQADSILGVSINQAEVDRANSLGLDNYSAILHNKFQPWPDIGLFDAIVDECPSGFACCLWHLNFLLDAYRKMCHGMFITDETELEFDMVRDMGIHDQYHMTPKDFVAAAKVAGFSCEINGTVYRMT